MRVFAIPSFVFWFSCVAAAQSPLLAPVKVDDPRVDEHRIGPVEVLHRTQQEMDAFKASGKSAARFFPDGAGYCAFNLVVSAGGIVESATQTDAGFGAPCSPHEQEAESMVRARRYEPWLVNGQPARVQIEDYVQVLPPERWGPQVAFPEKIDRSTLVFSLERTRCYGACPAYKVSIAGDGTVIYDGISSVALTGQHTAHIESSAVTGLLDRFRAANFLTALPSYRGNWTDNPTQTLTLSIDGETKKVVDYVGVNAGLPWAVRELEDAVDEAADTNRWVKGKGDLLAELEQEKWNFAAESADNLKIYRDAIGRGDGPLIQAFLKAHAPALSSVGNGLPPVCMAARVGNVELTKEMLQENKTLPAGVKNRCIVNAAMSGQVAMLAYWLDRGADAKANMAPAKQSGGSDDAGDWFEQQGLLANAARSGNPDLLREVLEFKPDVNETVQDEPLLQWTIERAVGKEKAGVVEVLLAAGADPNAKGTHWTGDTALFKCDHNLELVKPLLHAGAQIDARNSNGQTALIRYAFMEPFVKELLADGADPSLAGNRGETALTEAKRANCAACVKLIQDALDRKNAGASGPN
jgi:ankyrin repeat protein